MHSIRFIAPHGVQLFAEFDVEEEEDAGDRVTGCCCSNVSHVENVALLTSSQEEAPPEQLG